MEVFLYELRRTTRRGRPAVIRSLYGLVLLIAAGSIFPSYGYDPPTGRFGTTDLARISEQFASVFLVVQLVAVFLLTPAYVAGAVAEERQRRTLDDLLVTDLSNSDIVLGKLAARSVHVLGVLLTGVPVLSLMLSLGGVDPVRLGVAFLVTCLTALALAALSLLCSVRSNTVTNAVTATYAFAGLYAVASLCVLPVADVNPFVVVSSQASTSPGNDAWGTDLAAFSAVHLLLVAIFIVAAVRQLRRAGRDAEADERPAKLMTAATTLAPPWAGQLAPPAENKPPESPPQRDDAIDSLPRYPDQLRPPAPPMNGDPLLWKEEHFGGKTLVGETIANVGCFLCVGMLAMGPLLALGGWVFVAGVGLCLHLSLLISLAIGAAGGISREREGQTLDGLLVLPGGREAVLRAKWLGRLVRVRGRAIGLLAVLAFGGVTGSIDVFALVILLLSSASHAAFFASLGVCLSVMARSTARAVLGATLSLLGLCVLPPFFVRGMSPPVAWATLAMPAPHDSSPELGGPLFGLIVYSIAAGVLWAIASESFRAEAHGERRP